MPGCRLRPKLPLATLVECLWYWQGAPGPHLQERLLPDGTVEQSGVTSDDNGKSWQPGFDLIYTRLQDAASGAAGT